MARRRPRPPALAPPLLALMLALLLARAPGAQGVRLEREHLMVVSLAESSEVQGRGDDNEAQAPSGEPGAGGDIDKLREEREKLAKEVADLRKQADAQSSSPDEAGADFRGPAFGVMTWTLATIGGIVGLILIFGGVSLPKTSNVLTVGYGMGAVGFSVVWFGVSFFQAEYWWVRYAVSYGAAIVLGLLFSLSVCSMAVSARLTTSLVGAVSYMVLGIMLNTIGFHRLGAGRPSYFTFGVVAGSFFIFGAVLHLSLAQCQAVERRFLAMGAYAFLGSYLFIKFCGVAAGKYPNEWGILVLDSRASEWPYYLMFVFTFVATALAVVFQFFVYPLGPDDAYVEGEVLATKQYRASGYSKAPESASALPAHASQRRLASAQSRGSVRGQPEFGGGFGSATPLRGAGPSAQGADRYVSHF